MTQPAQLLWERGRTSSCARAQHPTSHHCPQFRMAPSTPGLRSKRECNSQGKRIPKPTKNKGQKRKLVLRSRSVCTQGSCAQASGHHMLEPSITAAAHQAAQLCVCATSTEDKRCNHGTTFPDSSGFQPSLKAQKISYMLANCTWPTSTRHPGTLAARELSHCWEQGKGSKVLGEVQRGRSDFHKEL